MLRSPWAFDEAWIVEKVVLRWRIESEFCRSSNTKRGTACSLGFTLSASCIEAWSFRGLFEKMLP